MYQGREYEAREPYNLGVSDRAPDPPPALNRPTHGAVANACGEPAATQGWFELIETPLVSSRALGRLLGLESLLFKVESSQPTGSWLDRSAAALVAETIGAGQTGICAVGVDAWALPLAIRCARAGLRFVILKPTTADPERGAARPTEPDHSRERRWLSALGTRTFAVEADHSSLQAAARQAVEGSGLRLVLPDDALLQAGLMSLVQAVKLGGHGENLLAMPALTGREQDWLATAGQSAAVPLPLADLPSGPAGQPFAVVGTLAPPRSTVSDGDASSVLAVNVSAREADAARRLLAREEGLLVSRQGGSGLAGLVRALREDRTKRPRERRLKGVTSAVVVLTGDPLRAAGDPPPEPDAVMRRPVSLDALQADLARLLVMPPGR